MARLISLVLVFLMLTALVGGAQAQEELDPRLQKIIENMTVEERVGQLFLVTYKGNDIGPDSDVARLIKDFKVGGVLLSPANGNFDNTSEAPAEMGDLTARLQTLVFDYFGSNVPLFVAMEADGNGYPTTWLRGGMTSVPSPLALGATWDPEHARVVGEIVGRELSAVGVNLLLGPPLDVLLTPRPGQPGDLKTRSFGGSPYWVGRMGHAYIQGIHAGSGGQVATVAKHFPGHGSSDRNPDQEAATVEKSLEEMGRTDLVPFLRVTDTQAEDTTGLTDALMTSHLRYRGFQGPTRPGSPPISFDPGGLKVLLDLPQLAPWRERGLLVSDSLGVPTVSRHFSPSQESFPHKEIAQKALVAGNDLLLMSRFALEDSNWETEFENVTSTIRFFREKYETDDTFQARVDQALIRILELKMALYPEFELDSVMVSQGAVEKLVGQDEAKKQVASIARNAVKLVAPGLQELADRIPRAPRSGDSIVIITDARQGSDCPSCETFQLIPETAIQETMLRLYGPEGTGQIDPNEIHSITYADLKAFLISEDNDEESSTDTDSDIPSLTERNRVRIEGMLTDADWIIFAMQDIDPEDAPSSDALRGLLKERPNSLTDKKVIVLAFGAPYYLDATEISKLTAYYAIFSKIPASIEAAVRMLFQEFVPTRALPVSVPGVSYELSTQLEPDPAQDLTVSRLDNEETTVNLGEEYTIQTSTILDRNGHPVPDGTKVTFWLTDSTDSTYLNFKEAKTRDGVATTTIVAERAGSVEIRAEAGEAQTAESLSLTIKEEVQPAPTATAEPPTPTEPPPTVTPSVTPTPESVASSLPESTPLGWATLAMSMLGMLIAGVVAISVDHGGGRALPQTLRLFLLSMTAGLVGYVTVGLDWVQVRKLPGLAWFPPEWQTPVLSTLFALVPLIWVIWERQQREL